MNNVNQKNEVFKTKRYSEIPYKYADTINFGYSQNINSGIINNTFQQLLDNDLFVENAIRDYATSQVGPKTDDFETVRNAYDGYKVLSDDNTQLFVLRKEDEKFGSKLETVLEGEEVNFSFCFGDVVVVGTNTGLCSIDSRGKVTDLLRIGSTGYSLVNNAIFFSTTEGIFMLTGNVFSMSAGMDNIVKIDDTFSESCKSVFYDNQDKIIYAGTLNGVYSAAFKLQDVEDELQTVRFEAVQMKTFDTPRINALLKNHESVVAATSNGIFQTEVQYSFRDYKKFFVGRDCRKQVQYNGNLYVAVHDSDNVYTVWKCGLDYENAQVLSSFDDITDMVAGDKYLYVACGDGITRYDGSAIQKLPLGISGVVGMDAFTFNNGEQLIVATQSDVYHVSEQLDVFKMDTVDIDEQITFVRIFGENRLFVGTTAGLYSYFLFKSPLPRKSDIVEGFREIPGVFDVSISGLSGTAVVDGQAFANSNTVVVGLKSGLQYGVQEGNIVKVVPAGNQLAIIQPTRVTLLNEDLMVQKSVELPGNQVIVDATSTNRLLVVVTDIGYTYKYQFDRDTELSRILEGDSVTKIASHEDVFSFVAKKRPEAAQYMVENALPTFQMDSRTGINRLRCIPEEDFVAASVVDGLILSSAAISGGNLGQPVILNPGVRSNDSIIFNGQIYNCTGQGIYRYQLSTDASGQKSGVYPDTAETFLESVPVYCATEYSGSVIVGTLSGVFALSSIIKNEDWTSKVAELASNVTEPLQFADTYASDSGILVATSEYVAYQNFDSTSCTKLSWPQAPTIINDVCRIDGETTRFCFATTNGFVVVDPKLNDLDTFADMTTETAAVFGFDDGIMVIPSNPSASRISIYRDGQLIPVGGDMPFFHIRHAVAWGTDVFMVGTNNKVYFGSFVHTTSGWILDGCQEIDVVIPDSAAQYNFRKLALNGGYLFIWDNSTLRRFVIERTQDRVSLSYDSDCVSDVNRWIPCSDGAVFGSSTGIFRLFGGAAGYIDVPNQAQTVIFIGDSYFNDAPEYGTASVADEIFNLNFFRFEDEFVRLNDDVDNTTPVTSLDVQFGCVFATMPKLKGRMAVKKPTTLYDIGNLVDGYKLVFSEAKQVSPVDFGFVYLPENNTAYVFSKNYVCEWGAYSDQTLIDNADSRIVRYIQSINDDLKQIIQFDSSFQTLMDVLKMDDTDFSGVAYISNKGVYLVDESDMPVNLINTGHVDMGIRDVFSTSRGIITQLNAGSLQVCSDGMHTDGIFLGESVNPGPITDICVVGDALIMRGYLPSLRWFQYKNGMKIFLPENGIVAICHDVNVNGVSGTDAAVSQNKVYGVVYGLATYCELQDKETVVSGSRAIQMYTADSKPNFILSNQEQFQFIVDEYARVVMLNIDSIPRQYFDAVIPVDGNPGHLIVVFDGRQYLVESREAQELLSSFDNSVHTAQKVGDYTSVLSETGIETFQKYGKNVLFVPIDGGERIDASSMCKLYDGNVVICGANGLYRFISDAIYRISDIYRPSALTMDNSSEHLAFAVGSGGTLYKSSNCKKWESVLQIPDAAAINNIYVKNQMEFYISTSNGLYRTVYSYNLVNDFESRNEFEMREFVQQLSGELDIIYNADFQRHLAKYHSGSSPITRINDAALSVNLDTPAPDWCTSSNGPEYIVNNGMVYSMDFGDYTTGVFHVDLSSYLGNFSNVEAEYITKNYMGGVSELFIHVDTTNNYYLNFMDGTPNCTSAQAATPRTRRNLENSPTIPKTHRQQDSIVSSHYTTITVGLNAQVFDINNILGIEINGCSLPLKIYKDVISPVNPRANNMFGGLMLPSLVGNYTLNSSGEHVFTFYCFGTDEQSIKITYMSGENGDNSYLTLAFDSNGGSGSMQNQKVPVGGTTTIRSNAFTRSGYYFTGWSFTAAQINSTPMFKPDEKVTFSSQIYEPNTTVTLYAVWSTVDPTADYRGSNELTMDTKWNSSVAITYVADREAQFEVENQ